MERECLLLVESDPLLRWSITTYLNKGYEVHAVETEAEAYHLLSDHFFDAIVVSVDPHGLAAQKMEGMARLRNADVRIVQLVTRIEETSDDPTVRQVEKPFELESLSQALLVGVGKASKGRNPVR